MPTFPIGLYDFGGNGPDLVLSHASGFCASMWAEVAEYLVPHFHVVGYDTRGHGRSSYPGLGLDDWNWENFADDLEFVIAHFGLRNPFGVGHSSGGATEVLLEERKPGTFAGLFLWEPILFDDDPPLGPQPDRELAVRTLKRRDTFASREEALENFQNRGPFKTLTPLALEAYVDDGFHTNEDGSITLNLSPENEAHIYEMATAQDGYLRLNKITCHATFAHGEHSTSFRAETVEAMSEQVSHGRFENFAGLGHFGPLEDPRRFADAVIQAFS